MSERSARLDLQGGLAGDMFVAAMIDAFPEFSELCRDTLRCLSLPSDVAITCAEFHDGVFGGHRLQIQAAAESHHHRTWSDIRRLIEESLLDIAETELTLAIFGELAMVEARIHQCPLDEVSFHEVGAIDSILDIVLASRMVVHSGITKWDCSPIPWGHGRVATRHGMISVPAPATRMLLEGFECLDDGIGGERVTPTGAAILKSLVGGHKVQGQLIRTGVGFGQKTLVGISNCVWLSVFEAGSTTTPTVNWNSDYVDVIEFEIDDSTPEELANASDHWRNTKGVLDVAQFSGVGKKGRYLVAVQILSEPQMREDVVRACFVQSSTIGLRVRTTRRHQLEREIVTTEQGIRVKIVERPDGTKSAKAESDDLAKLPTHANRTHMARMAIDSALPEKSQKGS